jgi:hypothetical protein
MSEGGATEWAVKIMILAAACGDRDTAEQWPSDFANIPPYAARLQAASVVLAKATQAEGELLAEAIRCDTFSLKREAIEHGREGAEGRLVGRLVEVVSKDSSSGLLVTLGGDRLELPMIRFLCHLHGYPIPVSIGATNRALDLAKSIHADDPVTYDYVWHGAARRPPPQERAEEYVEGKALFTFQWLLQYMLANRLMGQREYRRCRDHFRQEFVAAFWTDSPHLFERFSGI